VGIRDKLLSNAISIAVNTIAIIAFVLLILTSWRTSGLVTAAIALVATGRRSGTAAPGLLAVSCGLLAAYVRDTGHTDAALIVTGLLTGLVIANQPILDTIIDRPTVRAANLDGYRPRSGPLDTPARRHLIAPVLVAAIGAAVTVRLAAWPVAVVAGLAATATGVVTARAIHRRVRGDDGAAVIRAALIRHDPRFLLHFSAPDETEYHVEMWWPYLERIDLPWAVVVREDGAYATLSARAAGTRVPVLLCPNMSDLDTAITPGVRTVFYVNNGMKNTHLVRLAHLRHIQLLHGDSDKPSSFNPVTAMFDRVFVAGQAGIDRYAANGVSIPVEKFDIVGRPQVEAINVARTPIRDAVAPVVLYATTWVGAYDDTRHSSLPIGTTIVTALLARGATVILRPHPYTYRHLDSARHLDRLDALLAADRARTGRPHVFGPAATTGMTLIECANRADALISDVSGVASDFLYSEKPFALTNMSAAPVEEFTAAFPLAGAAYVIDERAGNIGDILDALLGDDPLEEARRKAKAYYLGEFDSVDYADGFIAAARRYCELSPIVTIGHDQRRPAHNTIGDAPATC
jgi:hypothetical protein